MATGTVTQTEPASSGIELKAVSPLDKSSSGDVEKAGITDPEDVSSNTTPPPEAVEALQKWNSPPIHKYRVFATFWAFFVLGMNDGSYGALIPHLETYYNLDYTVVSLVFLSPFAGYTLASLSNNFVVMYIFVGFGNGLIDAAWCAWIGNMANAHELSGMITSGNLGWYSFYYVMLAGSAVELLTSASTFWSQTGATYLAENPRTAGEKSGRTREALRNKVTWIFAIFILAYCGAEVSLSGWIVVFMTRVRGASSFAGGASATGFWGGMTVGRLFLAFLTSRIGENKSMMIYLGLSVVLELIFWLVPNLVVSAVSAALLGMFMGPMFPTAIVVTTKLLPRSLHVGAIGFGTAFGGSGGAILPFMVGAIAQARCVKSLQPVILALLVVLGILWAILPRTLQKDHGHSDKGIAAGTRNSDPVES
ncbi:uncharacterized protein BP5553_01635 [Venustampulla echinocandica]|uniref:Major facilitator superfamily (MFS) profile domain-containing protein n=1 Tax=Venustampulla echinocandica TaxID=2656787 RepID=A0A370U1J9_9HELO|nr:uncharacterized protein BP5553_01635 [Venustampulla echinocandica]RDL41656.1 hypothetical protein BP5553_01635 [Venustampulla echinocandica]